MNAISNFIFHESYNVRVQLIDGEPWFCLPDVCKILTVDRSSDLIRSLDSKGVVKNLTPTKGGNQQLNYVNEPNLYRVIFRSNKPEAKQFQDWVFNEVLPTIRKTGKYEAPKPVEKREYLTTSDMNNFKRLIYSCRHQLDHKDAWNQGIWYALRDVTGVPSPARFEVQHLPVLAQEFQRILSIILPFIKAKHECEQALIKQVLRGRGDHAVIQVLLNNMHQSTNASLNEFNQVLQKHLPMTFNQECLNLLNRRPNHYDHSDCNERLI